VILRIQNSFLGGLGGSNGLLCYWGSLGFNNWSDNLLYWLSNFGFDTTHLSGLAGNSLVFTLRVLGSTCLTLGVELSNTDLLSLKLVDSLHKNILVFELVTLCTEVELVVNVLVDFLGVSVLLEESTENAGSADGKDLGGHTGLSSTLSVTSTLMATLSLLGLVSLNTGTGVHGDLSLNDDTILVELSDVLARVSKSNFTGLVGINPNSLSSDFKN
jgi:hypothetical protein